MNKFINWGRIASQKKGITVAVAALLDHYFFEHHLQHMHVHTLRAPLGKWAGRLGETFATNMYAALEALKPLYLTQLSLHEQEFDQVLRQLPEEWEKYHTQYEFYRVYGQKPLETEIQKRGNQSF